jgi:DNA topoisomerase IB
VSFIRDGRAVLNFRGKGGIPHEVPIGDKRIAKIVKHCQELPGQQLFQYVTDEGQRAPIDSGQVNDYLRDAMGDDFTAKDFRTWAATWKTASRLAKQFDPNTITARKRVANEVVKSVASDLGNTPAVCRSSYIHPTILSDWMDGKFRSRWNHAWKTRKMAALSKEESATLAYLV